MNLPPRPSPFVSLSLTSNLVIPLNLNTTKLLNDLVSYLDSLFIIVVISFLVTVISFLVLMIGWGNLLDLRYVFRNSMQYDDYPRNRCVNISFKRMTDPNDRPFIVIYDNNQITSARLKTIYPSNTWSLIRVQIDGIYRIGLRMPNHHFQNCNTPVTCFGHSAILIPRPNAFLRDAQRLKVYSNHRPVTGIGNKIYIIG